MPYKNPEVSKQYHKRVGRERIIRCKTAVLTHYGKEGTLQCCWPGCDVTDIDCLQLDHIVAIGTKNRTKMGNNLYSFLLQEGLPEGYQTLCCNHNFKKELMRVRGE